MTSGHRPSRASTPPFVRVATLCSRPGVPNTRLGEWAADPAQAIVDFPGIGPVEQRREVTEVSLPFVSFRYTYRFLADGAVVTSDSTLRFRSCDEVESSLVAHGYRVLDVREAPDRPGREFVVIAKRTT